MKPKAKPPKTVKFQKCCKHRVAIVTVTTHFTPKTLIEPERSQSQYHKIDTQANVNSNPSEVAVSHAYLLFLYGYAFNYLISINKIHNLKFFFLPHFDFDYITIIRSSDLLTFPLDFYCYFCPPAKSQLDHWLLASYPL